MKACASPGRVTLAHQHFVVAPVPAPRPVLVGPADAERKIGFAAREHFGEGSLEQLPAAEPVIVVAERVDAVRTREHRLRLAYAGIREIVIAELTGHVGLPVSVEIRTRLADVGPFGEPFSPPFVVLGNAVELRQVERDHAYGCAVSRCDSQRQCPPPSGSRMPRRRARFRLRPAGGPAPPVPIRD